MGLRRIVIGVVALASIAGIVAVAVVARNEPDPLAELRVRAAQVEVSSEGLGPRLATEGTDLSPGDIVRTDQDGEAQIDLFDSSLVRLDTSTEVVLSKLVQEPSRNIAIEVTRGRTWNRVAELVSGADRFTVSLGDATVSVRGTTFITDCRRAPECYVVGVDGATEVASGGQETSAETGDCVLIRRDEAIEDCDEMRLGLIDDWVKENLAEDQQLELDAIDVATPSVSPTPVGTRRSFVPGPAPRPAAPTPTATSDPTVTDGSTPTPERTIPSLPTKTPRPKKTPAASGEPCEPEPGGTPCPYPD
ncbi:MAG: FecR family protein [Actinomycetota bacterium]